MELGEALGFGGRLRLSAVGECGDAEFGGGVGDEGDLFEGLGGGDGAWGDGVGYAVDGLPGF